MDIKVKEIMKQDADSLFLEDGRKDRWAKQETVKEGRKKGKDSKAKESNRRGVRPTEGEGTGEEWWQGQVERRNDRERKDEKKKR
jgi:hypothetical protein